MNRRGFILSGCAALAVSLETSASPIHSVVAARHVVEGKTGSLYPVLPDGATALDYVDCIGGQNGVEVLGVVPSEGTDFFCMATPNPTSIICIFGCGGAWIGHQTSYVLTSSNGSTGMTVGAGSWNEYAIVDGKVCLNGDASGVTTAIIGKPNPINFGAYASGGSYSWKGKLGRFWAIRNGVKIADAWPCLHNNKYGFCDMISGEFLREGNFPSGGYL